MSDSFKVPLLCYFKQSWAATEDNIWANLQICYKPTCVRAESKTGITFFFAIKCLLKGKEQNITRHFKITRRKKKGGGNNNLHTYTIYVEGKKIIYEGNLLKFRSSN